VSVDIGVGAVSNSAELQREQAYFDHAKQHRDGQSSAWSMTGASAGTAVERRAFKNAMEKRKVASPEDPVALTRIDYEDGDKLYIGKVAIFDADKNLLVVNWQAPAAAVANQASVHNPLGLRSKRTFDAPANRISSFEDIVFKALAEAVNELDDHSYTGDALLQSLSRKRGSEMTDIVKTIQAAQDKLVRADKDQLLIVQGGPGTGKTAVALHRVSWLLFNYQDELPPEDVLVVGPNPTFTRYIRRVLPDLGDDDVVQQALQNLLSNDVRLTGEDTGAAATVKGSARMSHVLERALKQRIRVPSEDIRIQRRNTVLTVAVPARTIAEVLETLQFGSFASGRRQFRQRLIELCAPLLGNIRQVDPEQFLEPKALEAEVEKIWPQITPQQFLRDLYGSRERLKRAAEGHLTADEMDLLYRQQSERIADEPWTMADLALLDEAQARMRQSPRTYGHIVVDEAQDLSKMQLRAVRRRSKNGSMTVVGDIAQSTGPYSRDSWDDVALLLGHGTSAQGPTHIVELEHGYRVPKQVFDVALPILASAAPSVTAPRILRDVDYAPRFASVPEGDLALEVARTVFGHSGRGRFVGVVAPVELWPSLREAFRSEDLQWSESTEGELSTAINLVTPEDAKGLEFDAVIVVDPSLILQMPHGERMLYIALTRTTTHLDVIYPLGSLPRLLGGSDEQTLALSGDREKHQVDSPVASTKSQDTKAGTENSDTTGEKNGSRTIEFVDPEPVSSSVTTASTGTDSKPLAEREMATLDGMQQAMAAHWAMFFSTQLRENVPVKLIPAVLEELAQMKLDDDD
jgi:DNA helicase IV